jgi:addiction module HigA family antidote
MGDGTQLVHPGIILLEQVMKPLGISRNQLARDVDVPVGRISDITNGKRAITADTALRLAHYFGTDAALWVRLQAEYDLHLARMTKWAAIKPRVRMLQLAETAEHGPTDTPPGKGRDGDPDMEETVAHAPPDAAAPVGLSEPPAGDRPDAPAPAGEEIHGDGQASESEPEPPPEPPGVRWPPAPPEQREAVVEAAEEAVTPVFSNDKSGWSR